MWPKNWRRCEPPKKTLEIPLGRPIVTYICAGPKKVPRIVHLGQGLCVCVLKYLARSRPQRNTFSRDQKRQELKSTMQFECFQQFQTFPILIACLMSRLRPAEEKNIKEGENYFWGVVNPVVSLQRTDSPGLCPAVPTREDQRTSRRRRRRRGRSKRTD